MKWHRTLMAGAAIGAQLFLSNTTAGAHATDEYGHNTLLSVTTFGVQIESQLTVGPLVSAKLIEIVDTDQNNAISADELRRYGDTIVADLELTVDGASRPITLISLQGPSSVGELRSGAAGLLLTAVGAGPVPTKEFTFVDKHRPLKGPAQASLLSENSTPANVKIIRNIERGIRVKGSFGQGIASGGLTVSASPGQTASASAASSTSKRTKTLQRYLSEASSPWTMTIALGAAALLGAFHALTPGHGKTIAAAYLIGERATVRHAVTLGLSTTITHTASVLLLGAMSLGFASFVEASALLRTLRICSGLLIVGLGLFLLVKRARGRNDPHGGHSFSDNSHFGEAHGHSHGLDTSRGRLNNIHKNHLGGTHSYDLDESSQSQEPNHSHQHDHAHAHNHGHAHSNSSGSPMVSTRRLIAMGASGGLLPCPEALGVLILAVGVQRQVFGMAMIVAFSAGLASVLVAVGIAFVRTRSLVHRFATIPESMTQTWLPVASALVVTVLGFAILSGRVV